MSKEYVIGNGKVSIGVTQHKKLPKVYIYIKNLVESFDIGTDLLELDALETGEITKLQFINVESIDVFIFALDRAKYLLQIKLDKKEK